MPCGMGFFCNNTIFTLSSYSFDLYIGQIEIQKASIYNFRSILFLEMLYLSKPP